MARSSMMIAMCLVVVASASTAVAQSSGNMNFLTPVTGLPHLAKAGTSEISAASVLMHMHDHMKLNM